MANIFGLNDSRYQWVVDSLTEEELEAMKVDQERILREVHYKILMSCVNVYFLLQIYLKAKARLGIEDDEDNTKEEKDVEEGGYGEGSETVELSEEIVISNEPSSGSQTI